jgi:hypothetical protein
VSDDTGSIPKPKIQERDRPTDAFLDDIRALNLSCLPSQHTCFINTYRYVYLNQVGSSEKRVFWPATFMCCTYSTHHHPVSALLPRVALSLRATLGPPTPPPEPPAEVPSGCRGRHHRNWHPPHPLSFLLSSPPLSSPSPLNFEMAMGTRNPSTRRVLPDKKPLWKHNSTCGYTDGQYHVPIE